MYLNFCDENKNFILSIPGFETRTRNLNGLLNFSFFFISQAEFFFNDRPILRYWCSRWRCSLMVADVIFKIDWSEWYTWAFMWKILFMTLPNFLAPPPPPHRLWNRLSILLSSATFVEEKKSWYPAILKVTCYPVCTRPCRWGSTLWSLSSCPQVLAGPCTSPCTQNLGK